MLPKKVVAVLKKDVLLSKILNTDLSQSGTFHATVFHALLSSIVSQQLSVKAAATIHRRFVDLFEDPSFAPDALLSQTHEVLRSVGLSNQKAKYVKNVAQYWIDHQITDEHLAGLSDADVIKLLTEIKGVGTWTVQMILMFFLDRPDIFPVDDLGIQNKMKHIYQLEGELKLVKKEMTLIAENWRPYRTYASRLLWACEV